MYDLAIIGSGWAGVNAALKAKELGLKSVIIEKSLLGGTCLNQGCIPTKTLIHSTKAYTFIRGSGSLGIEINGSLNINLPEIQARKDHIIRQLRQGIEFLLKGVELINAEAKFISADTIKVGEKKIQAKSILIASGSEPLELKGVKFDGKKIISSNDALNLRETPKSVLIIGGGVIGCEFVNILTALGAKVEIAELAGRLLPGEDYEASRKIESIFNKKGVKVSVNYETTAINYDNYDLVIVCIGRRPKIDGLDLEIAGIATQNGKIAVDEYLRTNIPNIYAAGDCLGGIMLAHYAAYQGKSLAMNLACGKAPVKITRTNVPNCIFTDPEIASAGLSEEGAKRKGIEIKVYRRDFLACGMARIIGETDGFMKIIADKEDGKVMGASIVGPKATELIATLVLAIDYGLTINQLRDTIFPHPTLSELIIDTAGADNLLGL